MPFDARAEIEGQFGPVLAPRPARRKLGHDRLLAVLAHVLVEGLGGALQLLVKSAYLVTDCLSRLGHRSTGHDRLGKAPRKRRNPLMICDVHAHYTPKNFSQFMGDRFASPVHLPVKRGMARHPFSDSPEDIDGRFQLMDEAGVEKQVLSPNHPPYLPDEAECVKAVRMLNDGYAALDLRYPKRIASYVMLPLPHIAASLKEMERGFDQLGCVGVNMNIICLGRSIAETEFEPIYAEMNRRGAVLFVHPAGSGICSPFIVDYNYRASVGTSLEDATFILH